MKRLKKGKRYFINHNKTATGVFNGSKLEYGAKYTFKNIEGDHNFNVYDGTGVIGFSMYHTCFEEVSNA